MDGALDLASWLHVLEDPKTLLCLKEGRPVEMPSKLMSHQAVTVSDEPSAEALFLFFFFAWQAEVQFRNGLPYRVDHVLLKKMIKSGQATDAIGSQQVVWIGWAGCSFMLVPSF